jgi:Fe-Mn family superoxide dismutase
MIMLPNLSYPNNALEPYIDARTMEIHYGKHHKTYVDKYNAVISKYPQLEVLPVEKVLSDLTLIKVDEKDRVAIKNHGGGVHNHNLFWSILGPKKEVDEKLTERIMKTFGSLDTFKEQFAAVSVNHFGSGWAWLVENEKKELVIYSLPNQDSPLTLGHVPILTLDVWEHAYYLTYQNRRAEYVANWWNVLKLLP